MRAASRATARTRIPTVSPGRARAPTTLRLRHLPAVRARATRTGIKYVGQFQNGMFHGKGTLIFSNGVYNGVFKNGKARPRGARRARARERARHAAVFTVVFARVGARGAQEVDGEYVFNDGLEDVKGTWDYATSKDRRFYTETLDTIKPAGELQYTDRVPAPELPKDCYDVGNGYFDPKNGSIHDYATKKKIRDASEKELQWATKKCRVSDIGGGKSSSS